MVEVTLLSHGFQSEYEIGLANGLAHNGVDVVLVGSDSTLAQRAIPGVKILNLRGNQSPNRSVAAKLRNMMRYFVEYLTFLAKRRGHPVHVIGLFSTRSTAITLIEAWLTRLAAGPYVLTVHDLLPHDRHTAFNQFMYRLIYRAPDMLMVHTNRMASELTSGFAVAPSRIVVVEHGFDRVIEHDAEARTSWRKRNGIPVEAEIVLFFGYVKRYKGLDLLLEAFATAGSDPARHLVIAGMCRDPDLRSELETAIRIHPFATRIHWRDGFVPHGEVASLIHAADCLAMPYRHIDQSAVLLMAMSSGLPIVATDVGSIAEYVSPSMGEIVPAGDVSAFAAALDRVVFRTGATSRSRLIETATRFEWRHTVNALVATYRVLWPEGS
jgi:glycosyltransferase involved in cell wall biosynthesis